MEQVWDKRKLARLMQAEPEAIDDFFDSYADLIFTWLYYQVGADPDIALELTERSLCESIRNLNQFEPSRGTFPQWLRQQTKKARDEGLLARQIKPQRPWAWSQLPDPVLAALSKLKSEHLDDVIVSNTYVKEIVQASLVEMEQANSELMVHRYNHLFVPEHIAEEIDMAVEEVNDRLYRCRHSFRRIFFQLIALCNPGFSESSAAGTLEILDSNLEKLLSAVAVYQKVPEKQRAILRDNLIQVAQQETIPQSGSTHQHLKPIIMGSAALAVFVILAIGIFLITRPAVDKQTSPEPEKEIAAKEKESEKTTVTQLKSDEIDEDELKRVLLLGQSGNLKGLLDILKNGQFTSQYTAAHFIGQLGDESAIGLLEEAEQKWYPDGPDENPFSTAIIAIEDRLYPETEVAVNEEMTEPTKELEPIEQKATEIKVPTLAGTVTDFSGKPVSGAKIEIYKTPSFGQNESLNMLNSFTTKDDGTFQFTDSLQGGVWNYCRFPGNDSIYYRQALWFQDGIARINSFGGPPALTGTITESGQPLAGQQIILRDSIQANEAAFYAQSETDSQGNYFFLGVQPGLYYLFDGSDGSTRLSVIESTGGNTTDIDLDLTPVEVILDADVDPDGLQIVRSVLMYTPDMTSTAFRIIAFQDNDGTFVFNDVLPGSYYLMTMLDNETWMQQDVEILPSQQQQTILLNPIPDGHVNLTGRFINPTPVDLFLTNANQQVRIPLVAGAGNAYQVELIPADVYQLVTRVYDTTIEFMEIDLQNESEILDLDPIELINSYSPLFVTVINTSGQVVAGAQVWLTGGVETITTQSNGRGAFLAAPAGEYTLYTVQPGQPAVEKNVVLKESSLLAGPNADNTVILQLGGR